jgi:hypothetical protein
MVVCAPLVGTAVCEMMDAEAMCDSFPNGLGKAGSVLAGTLTLES